MADLVKFTRRTDLPLLSQAGIAHAQFETIHPFPDGNGRTGRALIHAMLRGHGLTRNVTVPVSAGLLTDTNGYFDALTAYREGDPAPIVEKLANTSFAAAANGRQLVLDLRKIRQGWEATIKARRGATAWQLAEILLRQPVIDTPAVARELGVTPKMRCVPSHHSWTRTSSRSSPASPATGCGSHVRCSTRSTTSRHGPVVADENAFEPCRLCAQAARNALLKVVTPP